MRATLQHALRRLTRRKSDEGAGEGELNIVPLLDIVTNVMLFLLATVATSFTASVFLRAPGQCLRDCPPVAAVDHWTLQVLPDGYMVAGERGFLQPDCARWGQAAVTIPARAGRPDAEALRACLLRARGSFTAAQLSPTLRVSIQGQLPYGELLRAMDAARESAPGAADLFPEVQLGILTGPGEGT